VRGDPRPVVDGLAERPQRPGVLERELSVAGGLVAAERVVRDVGVDEVDVSGVVAGQVALVTELEVLLLQQAAVAVEKVASATGKDKAFYEGKIAAAKWFAASVFPELSSKLAIAQAVDLSLMELDESAF
jgi:hypothetical protein